MFEFFKLMLSGGAQIESYRAQDVAQALRRLSAYLAEQQVVRMFVDSGGGRGHQIAAIRVLDRMAAGPDETVPGLGYTGSVQIYYNNQPGSTVINLRNLLLWQAGQNDGAYKGMNVVLIPLPASLPPPVPLDPMVIGLSGASDLGANIARGLNIGNYLRLQPFLWDKANQLQFADAREPINLATVPQLGGESFLERGSYLTVPTTFDWGPYVNAADPNLARRAQVLQYLIDNRNTPAHKPRYRLLVTYSIHTTTNSQGQGGMINAIGTEPNDQVVELISGVLASQRGYGAAEVATALPAVIVNLDDFYHEPNTPEIVNGDRFTLVKSLLAGALTPAEARYVPNPLAAQLSANQIAALQVRNNRSTYLTGINAAQRTHFITEPTLLAITNEVTQWLVVDDADVPMKQKVLWVQLTPPFAPNLFDYVLSKSTLPPVFEGVNTANFALNVGRMYYHVNRPRNTDILYPTRVLASTPAEPKLRALQTAANQVGVLLSNWPADTRYSAYPPELFAAPIIASQGEPLDGTYTQYFRQLGDFYRQPANDKLSLALTYLSLAAVPPAQIHPLVRAGSGRNVAADTPPLEALWATLSANFSGENGSGSLALVPGALDSGRITELLSTLLKAVGAQALRLEQATLLREPAALDITRISLSGAAAAFGVTAQLSIEFTAPQGRVRSALKLLFKGSSSIPGMPWVEVTDPFLTLQLYDDGQLSWGVPGMQLKLGNASQLEVNWRFPAPDDSWLISARTTGTPPTAASVFQLAGGIDLVTLLPAPFNVLADLGLAGLELGYQPKNAVLNYAAFELRSASKAPIALFGKVALNDLSIHTAVTSPADLANRRVEVQVSGTFILAKDPTAADAANIRLSAATPRYLFAGELVSGTLHLEDLLFFFLPDTPLALPQAPTLTALQFSYEQPLAHLSLSVNLNIDWDISIGGLPTLTVEQLGLSVDTLRDQGSGRLFGTFRLFKGSADEIGLLVAAAYASEAGWTFSGQQTSGELDLMRLLSNYLNWSLPAHLPVNGLGVTLDTRTQSWTFTANTAHPWTVDFLPDASLTGKLRMGYNGKAATTPARATATVATGLPAAQAQGAFGRLEATLDWHNIGITVWYDYNPEVNQYGITWEQLQGTVSGPAPKTGDWTATLSFTRDTTLGSMIETMVAWVTGSRFGLEAPWSVLNAIPLSGLALKYTFNKADPSRDKVSFSINIGPIELGFARISSIDVGYESTGADRGVMVSLNGTFAWQADPSAPLAWDASQPGSAPAPPGNGNKYLDLRLLAMGQHVTLPDFANADTVQKAIACMAKLPDPKPGEIPPVQFDARSAWLIGTDFGLLKIEDQTPKGSNGYVVTLQAVFNDPHLYGLRIALEGSAAKVFKGLDFQIMYRQISDMVGVYQADITLPDLMRHLSVGAYSLTLPVFGISVYTNGDFQVDVGFPWNENFARSFSIEAIIPPGIPVLGSAGLYFGKLSSATTSRVPVSPRGTFNPVLVFGFGMQVGFGKSIEYGVLKAGFSVTVVGILEGLLAKWNPYLLPAPQRTPANQVQGEYYFWLRGTVGIVGKVYGSVDFAIIKADVNLTVKLLLQLTYESYVSVAITVIASVEASVSVRINLGLFKIRISFSFSMRLKETFTIANEGTAPWSIAPAARGLLRQPLEQRLSAFTRTGRLHTGRLGAATGVNWGNLQPGAGALLRAYLVPGLSAARDEWASGPQPAEQVPCWVTLLLLESVPAAGQDDGASRLKARGAAKDASFEALAKMVLRWAVAAVHGAMTPEQADDVLVDTDLLDLLASKVLVSRDDNPTPIPLEAVQAFMQAQFQLSLSVPPSDQDTSADTTYFPVPPQLRLTLPAYGDDYPGVQYTFGNYNTLGQGALAELRAWFDELAVQVEREQAGASAPARALKAGLDQPLSMASWMFVDYFLLIARQMVKAAQDALRDFKYPCGADEQPDAVVTWVNRTGKLGDTYTLGDLFTANARHPLAPAKHLIIGATHPVGNHTSLTALASHWPEQFSATDLALANAATPALVQAAAIVTYPGRAPYTTQAGDTLGAIATQLAVSFNDLLADSDLLSVTALLAPSASVQVPYFTCTAQADDTFTSISARGLYAGGFSAAALATANAGYTLLREGSRVDYPNQTPHTVQPRDTLIDVAAAFAVPLADLLAHSKVLTQPGLLAPVATLNLPSFSIASQSGDTLAQIAARFGVPAQVLAEQAANGAVAGLFDPASDLDLPHLPRFPLRELLAEIQRTGMLQHLGGMASSYMLHGLRLPTRSAADGTPWAITPNAAGMWVRNHNGTLALPPQAGLYALTGQQFALPALGDEAFSVTFDQAQGAASWLAFSDAQGGATDHLVLSVTPGSADATRIAQVATAARQRLDIPLHALGAGEMFHATPASYPFTSAVRWLNAGPVALPYTASSQAPQALRLWRLPDALAALPNPATRAVNPRFALKKARFDQATGATETTDISDYGWATLLDFTVRRVPAVAGSPASACTYEVVGAGGTAVALLERLLGQLQADDSAYQSLLLGYGADASGATAQGVQTDDSASVTLGIAQVNLSTETRPVAATALRARALAKAGPLNPPSEFVRLLWEASITGAGGFYLYYFDHASGRGLPERVFNDRNEATLSLIVLHARPAQDAQRNRVANYMNAVVTGGFLDQDDAVLFAEAAPLDASVSTYSTQTLAALAYAWYCDPVDVAEANPAAALRPGAALRVRQGVFQAPPGGIRLQDVAQRLGTDIPRLDAANPRWGGLPDPLPFPSAIRVPDLDLTVGSSAHTASLADAAAWYGAPVAALGSDNKQVAGLFADGQTLLVPTGPWVRTASVQPGVQALTARRPAPPPAETGATDYGTDLLLNNFSLLNRQVTDNVDFRGSREGLPAAPTTEPAAHAGNDKVRTVRPLDQVTTWDYGTALPYSRFAKPLAATENALPTAASSPYLGVGGLLQIRFAWQDYYGNTLSTPLSDPRADDPTPYNQSPLRVGYTDPLVALSQWPSISASWQVEPATPPAPAQLNITLSLDPSRYQGMLQASATSPQALAVVFTDSLDGASAADVGNWSLPGASIASAVLQPDGVTVVLALAEPLQADQRYTLSADALKAAIGQSRLGGQASFDWPDKPDTRSSSVQRNALQDLHVYTQLYHQLTDPAGLVLSVQSSLLAGTQPGQPGSLPVPAPAVDALMHWLFAADDGNSLWRCLLDRSQFKAASALPATGLKVLLPIDHAALNPAQIFSLTTCFTMTRSAGRVLPGLEDTSGIRSASTQLAPAQGATDTPGETRGLGAFAARFEAALYVPGSQRLKVATGVDRTLNPGAGSSATLWAVRVGLASGQAISYAIDNPGNPAVFAPRPASNQLISRTQVPIHDYTRGHGLSPTPTRYNDFVDTDLDSWCAQVFDAVDSVLAPRYTSPMQILGNYKAEDYLQRILNAKKALAKLAAEWMEPVFAGTQDDPSSARESFYQQLLVRLANAYTTRAALEFHASVTATLDAPLAPRLFGAAVLVSPPSQPDTSTPGQGQASTLSFSSPKLTLDSSAPQPLTYLMNVPQTVRGAQGEVVSHVALNMQFQGAQIEHQRGTLPGINDYEASSWLSFLIADTDTPLTADLGRFAVPLPLRAFPASPTVPVHNGTPASIVGQADLAQLKQWDYSFTYSLPFHYPQDRVCAEVAFNLKQRANNLMAFPDAFAQLAEFVTVFPQVDADLASLLSTLDASMDPVNDREQIDNAAIALQAFIDLLERLTTAANGGAQHGPAGPGLRFAAQAPALSGAPALTYAFHVEEDSAQVGDTPGALVVHLVGEVPAGMGTPKVSIEPERYDAVRWTPPGVPAAGPTRISYVYRCKAPQTGGATYLSAEQGQGIGARSVHLPGLDILQRQDASATVWVERNRELVAGRPSADAFVYTTAPVRFTNPVYPSSDSSVVIDVAAVPSGTPVVRSLQGHLQALFDELLAQVVEPDIVVQVEISYAYTTDPARMTITLPVLMQAPLGVALDAQGAELAAMTEGWAQAVQTWLHTYAPSSQGARLCLDLTLMSNLTAQAMPLLRLRRLELAVRWLSPTRP